MKNGMRVCVDLNWIEVMADQDKDMKGCVRQLGYAYSANKKAEKPVQLHICGSEGAFKRASLKVSLIIWTNTKSSFSAEFRNPFYDF